MDGRVDGWNGEKKECRQGLMQRILGGGGGGERWVADQLGLGGEFSKFLIPGPSLATDLVR